jgi:hypothetical protein
VRLRPLAFPILLALHLLPVWSVRYPASCDGPAHLESARALLNRLSPEATIDRQYLALRKDPSVSWFASLALAGLLLVASPEVALKLFMSGCLILLAAAMRYALTAVDRGSGWLALLVLPLLYNTLFLYGLYSFLYGLGVLLVTVGYWLRTQGHAPREDWRLTGLALALQLTHVFCLLAAVPTLAALGAARALARRREAGLGTALRAYVLAPLYAFLPALALALVFLLPRMELRPEHDPAAARFLPRLPLATYGDARERWLAGSAVALVVVVALGVAASGLRRRRMVEADALLFVALFWLAFGVGAPERIAGGSFLAERAALCLLITLLLWCASRPPRGLLRGAAGALAATLALGLVAIHALQFRQTSRQVDAYVAAASDVAPGSALLPLGTSQPLAPARIPFLEHAASYVAIGRKGINLGNYQFAANHFPLAFRRRPGLARALEDGAAADVVLSWNEGALTVVQRAKRTAASGLPRPD